MGAVLGLLGFFLAPPPTRSRAITNVAVSPTGRWLAVGTHDGQIVLCQQSGSYSCVPVPIGSDELNDLQFSPDERFLAVAYRHIQLVALDPRDSSFFLRQDGRHYGSIRFNHTGTRLLTINARSQIELLDLSSHKTVRAICCSSFYGEVSFFPDDNQIVNAGHWPRIWTEDGHLVKSLTANRQDATFRPIVVDEKTQTLWMGSQDGRVYAWSLADYHLWKRSSGQNGYVDTIALLSKIQKVAYSSFGKPIHLWSLSDENDRLLPNLRSSSNLVALPDGKSILFGTSSGTIETWNLEGSPHLTSTWIPAWLPSGNSSGSYGKKQQPTQP